MPIGNISLGTLLVKIKSGFDNTGGQKAERWMDRFGKKMGMTTGQVAALGAGLAAVGIAAVSALTRATMAAASFQQSLAMSMTMTQLTGDAYKKMTKDMGAFAIQLSNELGIQGDKINESFYQVLSSGAAAMSEDFQGLARTGNMLAKTVGLNMADSVEILSDVARAFNISVAESEKIADAFFNASMQVATTVPQIAMAMKQVAPVAAQMGFSLNETIAVLNTMAAKGIKAEKAGVALRNILLRLADPPSEVQEALAALDVEVTNVDGSFKSQKQILSELKVALEGLTPEIRTMRLAQIASVRSAAALGAAISTDTAEIKKMENGLDAVGGLQKAHDEIMKTATERWNKMTVAITNFGIEIGNKVLPAVGGMADGVGKLSKILGGPLADELNIVIKLTTLVAKVVTKAIGIILKYSGVAKLLALALGFLARTLEDFSNLLDIADKNFKNVGKNARKLHEELNIMRDKMGRARDEFDASVYTIERVEEAIKKLKNELEGRVEVQLEDKDHYEKALAAEKALLAAQKMRAAFSKITREFTKRAVKKMSIEELNAARELINNAMRNNEFTKNRLDTIEKILETVEKEIAAHEKLNREIAGGERILRQQIEARQREVQRMLERRRQEEARLAKLVEERIERTRKKELDARAEASDKFQQDIKDIQKGYAEVDKGIKKMDAGFKKLDKTVEDLRKKNEAQIKDIIQNWVSEAKVARNQLRKNFQDAASFLASAMHTTLAVMSDGTKTLGERFKELGNIILNNVVSALIQAVSKALILQAITAITGGVPTALAGAGNIGANFIGGLFGPLVGLGNTISSQQQSSNPIIQQNIQGNVFTQRQLADYVVNRDAYNTRTGRST
ncbi:phage tail tape measure protein [bacterium]|nr:phage tail tape measure protein [bacterium]